MSEVCAYDIDGTIRPSTLVADAIAHGLEQGFLDQSQFQDPTAPTLEEIDYFVAAIKGQSRRNFKELTDRLSDEAIDQTMPWALERIDHQHRQGMHRILVSLSPDFVVKAYARGLGVHHAYGSYFQTRSLTFSGHAVTRNKPDAIKRYSRRHKLDGLAFAAGDTWSDVPMLEMARTGAVVNPGHELGKLALKKNWEIIRTTEGA